MSGEGGSGRWVRSPTRSNDTPSLPPGWPTPATACFLGGSYQKVRHPHELACEQGLRNPRRTAELFPPLHRKASGANNSTPSPVAERLLHSCRVRMWFRMGLAEALEQIRQQGCTALSLGCACRETPTPRLTPPPNRARTHTRTAGVRPAPSAQAARACRAHTHRAPQAMGSAPRGPRSWLPRSRATRPSPIWTSMVRAAATPPHTHPRHRRTRTRVQGERRARRAAPEGTRRMRSPHPHTARVPPPRSTGNEIGAEGAKELVAALMGNTTLTWLWFNSECRGAPHTPRDTPARACTRAWASRAPRPSARRARARRAHTHTAPTPRVCAPASRRQQDRRQGGQGAGRRAQG